MGVLKACVLLLRECTFPHPCNQEREHYYPSTDGTDKRRKSLSLNADGVISRDTYSAWFCALTARNRLDISASQSNTSLIHGKVGIAVGLKSLSVGLRLRRLLAAPSQPAVGLPFSSVPHVVILWSTSRAYPAIVSIPMATTRD